MLSTTGNQTGHRLLILSTVILLTTCISISCAMSLRTAVVTGSNRGLGLEMIKQLSAGKSFDKIYAICRKSSEELNSIVDKSVSHVEIIDGVEVTKESTYSTVKRVLKTNEAEPIGIDLLIHNAGAYGPPRDFKSAKEMYGSQSLENIDMEAMMFSFQLNTLAPLFLTKALLPNLKSKNDATKETTRKVIIISSLMGSITDNTGGSHYGYRTAKAGVNMVGKTLSVDLRDDKIAVGLVHPGYVYTGFGGEDDEKREGQRDVDESVRGVLEAVDQVTLENTGCFLHGNYGEGVKPLEW